MTGAKVKIRYISWSEIVDILAKLSLEISRRYKPDLIVAIAKGGLVPARILLDYLGVDEVGFIEVKFYKSVGVVMEKPFIKAMAIPPISDKNVLVVDDVVDSGRTMQLVINILSTHNPKSIKTASLFTKPWSTFTPDFYHSMIDEWIVFPWELCESRKEGVHPEHTEFRRYSEYCSD